MNKIPNAERKKELKEQYSARHPDKGIVCWKCGERRWVMASQDVQKDYNSTSFRLGLSSWPNREMQSAYDSDPAGFVWSVEALLDYEDPTEDYTDELTLMLMDYLEQHPEAKPMKPFKKL